MASSTVTSLNLYFTLTASWETLKEFPSNSINVHLIVEKLFATSAELDFRRNTSSRKHHLLHAFPSIVLFRRLRGENFLRIFIAILFALGFTVLIDGFRGWQKLLTKIYFLLAISL